MATVTNINGWNIGGNNNSFDQRGHFYRGVFSGNVSGMLVKQNSTPNMTVLVEHGSALLNKNTTSASVAEIKSDTSVTIDTANTSNPRIDTVVIYEDTSVAIPSVENDYWQDGAGGRFKIVSLPGTAAASPVALSDASIQTAIGSGKPWTRLADITVPTNSTTIVDSNIADKRVQMGGTIPNKSVTASKIDSATFTGGTWNKDLTQTYTSNTTMGNHTMYYRNIGGVIEVWGKTPAASVGNTTILVQIPFPPSLFTSDSDIQSAIVSASDHTVSATGYAQVNNVTKARIQVTLAGTSSGQNMAVYYLVRGVAS